MKLLLVTALFCALAASSLADPCDLWARYFSNINPSVNGWNAGSSAYFYYQLASLLSPAYIARGFRNGFLIPGRIQKPLATSVGAIWVTLGDEYKTNPQWTTTGLGEYFVLRDGCSCTWSAVTTATAAAISASPNLVRTAEQNTVSTPPGPFDYAISRTLTAGKVSIGKAVTPTLNALYTDPVTSLENANTPAQSVLVCSGTEMWTKPVVNFGTHQACALWSKYKPSVNANFPATHGFLFGLDRYGNPGFVGRGNYNDMQRIGRVQVTPTAGVYVPGGAIEAIATVPEYLVVPYNCNCMWLPFSIAVNKIGLVRSIDNAFGYAVGRVSLGNGRYALSSIKTSGSSHVYVSSSGAVTSTAVPTDADVLVCEIPIAPIKPYPDDITTLPPPPAPTEPPTPAPTEPPASVPADPSTPALTEAQTFVPTTATS